jgi:uncharacterized protein (TIGR03067 family)
VKRSALLITAACLLVAADSPAPKVSVDPLHGTWYIVAVNAPGVLGGREEREFRDTRFTLIFDGSTVTSLGDGKILWQGAYVLDKGGAAQTIDITRHQRPFKQGIYEQKGDTLKLCLDLPANPRPAKFAVSKGSRAEMMTFKRLKSGS